MSRPTAGASGLRVRVRFLDDPELCAWYWEIIDAVGTLVESSWQNDWTLYGSRGEALTAGVARLAARAPGSRGPRARGRRTRRTLLGHGRGPKARTT